MLLFEKEKGEEIKEWKETKGNKVGEDKDTQEIIPCRFLTVCIIS
jgi:hypothetical protein